VQYTASRYSQSGYAHLLNFICTCKKSLANCFMQLSVLLHGFVIFNFLLNIFCNLPNFLYSIIVLLLVLDMHIGVIQ